MSHSFPKPTHEWLERHPVKCKQTNSNKATIIKQGLQKC